MGYYIVANRITLNVLTTEFMLVTSRKRIATLTQELDLSINGIPLKRVNSSKCLGVEIDEFLTWDAHISSVSKKYGGREWPLKGRTQIQKSISKSNNSKLTVDY